MGKKIKWGRREGEGKRDDGKVKGRGKKGKGKDKNEKIRKREKWDGGEGNQVNSNFIHPWILFK